VRREFCRQLSHPRFGSDAGKEPVRLVENKCAHLPIHDAVRGPAWEASLVVSRFRGGRVSTCERVHVALSIALHHLEWADWFNRCRPFNACSPCAIERPLLWLGGVGD
jgi:hypothetical protein